MPAKAVLIESKFIPTKPIHNALKEIVTDLLIGEIGEHGAIALAEYAELQFVGDKEIGDHSQ